MELLHLWPMFVPHGPLHHLVGRHSSWLTDEPVRNEGIHSSMRKVLVAGGVTAAAVAAIIGAASTNSLGTIGNQTVGYSSADIQGATVDSVQYHVDQTADNVLTSVQVVFHTALVKDSVIQVGFGTGALAPCIDPNTDGTGKVTPALGTADVTCTLSGQTVTGATKFRLLVTGPAQS
jgi:hypothetical protein